MAKIRAVCFDAFGTVVEITDRRQTFKHILNNPYPDLPVRAMTRPVGIRDLAQQLDPKPQEAEILQWEAAIEAECASIRLRPRMKAIWNELRKARLQIAVCSNLAAPYAGPMIQALPASPDGLVLSYRVGLMKPHRDIYSIVALQLGLKLSQILFVGDRLEEDVLGPIDAGAAAMPVDEFMAAFGSSPSIFAPPNVVKFFKQFEVGKTS